MHPEQAGDDAGRGVVLVQRVRQLLPRRVERLPQLVGLQHRRVPLLCAGYTHGEVDVLCCSSLAPLGCALHGVDRGKKTIAADCGRDKANGRVGDDVHAAPRPVSEPCESQPMIRSWLVCPVLTAAALLNACFVVPAQQDASGRHSKVWHAARTLWNRPSRPGMLVAGDGRGFTACAAQTLQLRQAYGTRVHERS